MKTPTPSPAPPSANKQDKSDVIAQRPSQQDRWYQNLSPAVQSVTAFCMFNKPRNIPLPFGPIRAEGFAPEGMPEPFGR